MSDLADAQVLVTGAAGFIGSSLTERLVVEGARVRALCRYNSRRQRGALERLAPEILSEVDVRFGDLRDAESVDGVTGDMDVVFHLGAQIAVPYSFENPRDFFETNVLGTLNAAQAARRHAVRRFVHMSTSEVYGTAQTVPITEDHPLEPQSPYAASKVAAERLVTSWIHAFELPAVVIRAFNTYGPGQTERALVPTVISQALRRNNLRLGSLTPTRDLVYVTDTVAGLVSAARSPEVVGSVIQLGTGTETSVGALVDEVASILGQRLAVEPDARRIRPQGAEVQRLVADASRARNLLGWVPRVRLGEGLSLTVDWFRTRATGLRPEEYAT